MSCEVNEVSFERTNVSIKINYRLIFNQTAAISSEVISQYINRTKFMFKYPIEIMQEVVYFNTSESITVIEEQINIAAANQIIKILPFWFHDITDTVTFNCFSNHTENSTYNSYSNYEPPISTPILNFTIDDNNNFTEMKIVLQGLFFRNGFNLQFSSANLDRILNSSYPSIEDLIKIANIIYFLMNEAKNLNLFNKKF